MYPSQLNNPKLKDKYIKEIKSKYNKKNINKTNKTE